MKFKVGEIVIYNKEPHIIKRIKSYGGFTEYLVVPVNRDLTSYEGYYTTWSFLEKCEYGDLLYGENN